ncbi:hypothetical protein [Flavobacterium aquicola]|uniref:Uncharacterized protein n=1 Tax=Flavobacterium aquicola TaxID=1682742 RepID=A0A3E0EDG8_9FLAO|nr:hypothetical protein [Flavobacterium aquicola]REG96328.1 hypothetical protein C8P67_110155 [Flavobacterium aquicola]
MKYREELIEFLENGDLDKIMDWMGTKPSLDHTDIFRELQQIFWEIYDETGNPNILKQIQYYDTFIPAYEENVLNHKLAEANYVMAVQEQEKVMQRIIEATVGIRRYIMDCIINQEDNAEEMKELAQKIMASEKESGIYDENNWIEIL